MITRHRQRKVSQKEQLKPPAGPFLVALQSSKALETPEKHG
jgi:hypothetical protein